MKNKEKLIPELRFPEFKNEEEWENIELGKISEIVRGGSPRPIQDYLTNNENGLSWLKIADVAPDSKYITGTKEKVIKEALSSTRKVNPGDLILSNSMSFGRPYILKIRTCIHDGWIAIRKISNKTFEDYLYYYISSETSQKYFNTNAAGAAVKNLNADIIKLLPIRLSKNRKEQQKIASCLSSLDEVIEAHSQKLELLKEHKKGLLQNLFPQEGEKVPKVRFKEFEKDGVWVEKKLEKVAEVITGNTPSTNQPEYYNGEIMFVSPADINDNRYITQTKTTLTELGFSKTRHIKANSILFVCIGSTIGKIAQNKFECATNQQINSLIPFKEYSSDFLYSALENSASQISELAGIQAVPIINKAQFSSVKLFFPTIQEQQKIASCLSSLDELITAQTEKIEQLKQHKKGLMQGLFPK